MIYCTELTNRGVLKVAGPDRFVFLQGLLTNDVSRLTSDTSLYSLLLTPQGKHFFDLFLVAVGDEWWVEGDRYRLEELKKKLSLYKLRSNVSLDIDLDQHIFSLWGADVVAAFDLNDRIPGHTQHTPLWHVYRDPRHPALGARMIVAADHVAGLSHCEGLTMVEADEYRYYRYGLGVPESDAELLVDKSIPLENGMDELNAIDWQKGCYMGQELTSRTRYRGLVRKRLFPVTVNATVNVETKIVAGENEVGTWRSLCRERGLALIRLEALDKELTCGSAKVTVVQPNWMVLPEA
ncbi:YgfZ/GcvT domain-containing protein [Candidatus Paracaedibacter symbiosus]|uniref:CAF17-like 4Fe-4S cluster assembly/insertion protein YgfZ n=1 Tax=Candidatus Paracaedibacter symbiosus TaxID=244582 RepID=UPI000509AA91|nr:folate-binding protein YgfZ [Candidatus Paracaedibacter symbiosus]